ncbi:MAG: hypothetical protein VW338_00075 [Rhodospirillaceae bacterium]
MSILGILQAVLSLANTLMGYVSDRNLMDAGEAKSVAKGLSDAMDAIHRAKRARASVNMDADSLRDDPNNRDTLRGP